MEHPRALVWFRRDLRDADHAALHHALRSSAQVWCAFIFDTEILDRLPQPADRRVHFIRESLVQLDQALRQRGGGLLVRHGRAREEIPRLAAELGVGAVFVNQDYEPAAKERDAAVAASLQAQGVAFRAFKDQVVLGGAELVTQAGHPYTVFTPYKNAWLKRLDAPGGDLLLRSFPVPEGMGKLVPPPGSGGIPTLEEIGFLPTDLERLGVLPGMAGAEKVWADFRKRMARYQETRDFPAVKGTSHLSVHLRFGTVSVRHLAAAAWQAGNLGASTWLNELVWREFYFMILDRFPRVVDHNFRPAFDAVKWAEWPEGLQAWKEGRTGYPLVDAAMRQLNQTGWMHNRLRMVTASFLTKDLGIHWLPGERYFADTLLDYELASNNGGWQWAASTGCDAQPWFRIFNPVTQSEKFDPQGAFIRRYVPELARVPDKHIHAPWKLTPLEQRECGVVIGRDYPAPRVDHGVARQHTLDRFKAAAE